MSLPGQIAATGQSTLTLLDDRDSRRRPLMTDALCVLLILGFVLVTYVGTANILTTQDDKVIPTGDPFTYTLGFMQVRDQAHQSTSRGFWRALGNWYWLQNLIIFALSPILGRDPASMAAMNYLCLAAALCSLYAVGRQFTRSPPLALLGILGFVHLPWLYGATQHGELLCVSLDCAFLWMVVTAWSCLFLYALDPASPGKAALAAVATSLAVFGRGNSLPIVALVLFVPLLFIGYRVLFTRPRTGLVKPLAIYTLLTCLLVGAYLWCNLKLILEYYVYMKHEQVPAGLLDKLLSICPPPRWVRHNIPSVMMVGLKKVNTRTALTVSIIMHVFTLVSSLGLWWYSRRLQQGGRALGLLAVSTLATYVTTYGLGTYAVRGLDAHQPFCVFNMMLVSFSVLLMATIIVLLRRLDMQFRNASPWLVGLAGCSAFGFAVMSSRHHVLRPTDTACAGPSEVRAVSLGLDRITGGRTLAVMWYSAYNPVILNYYRYLEGVPYYNSYSVFHFPMFHTLAEQIEPQRFRHALRTTLDEADFVILPQNPEDCRLIYPCRMQRDGKTELSAFYADEDRPDYRVRMVLHDLGGARLLLLERLEEHAPPGTPLVLPRPFHGQTAEMAWDGVLEDKVATKIDNPPRFYLHSLQDGNPQSYWEGYGPFPHTLRVERRAGESPIAAYRLVADAYGAVRMPVAWRVEGSTDRRDWVVLDRRTDADWSAGQSREFTFAAPSALRYFQFVFEKGAEGVLRLGDIELSQSTPTGNQPVPACDLRLSIPRPTLATSPSQPSLQ